MTDSTVFGTLRFDYEVGRGYVTFTEGYRRRHKVRAGQDWTDHLATLDMLQDWLGDLQREYDRLIALERHTGGPRLRHRRPFLRIFCAV